MAFDGIMLRSVCAELNEKLAGGKVDRITQPERDEINIRFRAFDTIGKCNVNRTLLLSSNPSQSRVHLTQTKKENPAVAPNFCMLLRKHLTGAKFVKASQPGLERVLFLDFECSTELYETVTNRLVIEIMGRCSNLVFTDGDGHIYDAVHQVDFSDSEKRQILPGMTYTLPPAQDKSDLLTADIANALERNSTGRIDKRICEKFLGVAPLLGREAAFICSGATDTDISDLSDERFGKLVSYLETVADGVKQEKFSPVFLYAEKPLEYWCFDICQYGSAAKKITDISASEAIERYFSVKAAAEHIKRSSADITKIIGTVISRLSRKVEAQRGELKECEKADIYKRYGDIITSNMYLLKGGEKNARLVDYYAEEPTECTVELDPRLSPTANAQRYYKLYKKAQTAKKMLSEQIPEALADIEYLETVRSSVENASSVSELAQIRRELTEQGYIKQRGKIKTQKQKKPETCKPSEYTSSDGFTILVGKNNLQNDALTLKIADRHDIWFHIKNYAGSHVVVVTEGRTPPDSTLEEAAVLAATFSSADAGAKVEVDYTEVKNVKKPSGARPGKVIYVNYRTAVVTAKEKPKEQRKNGNIS